MPFAVGLDANRRSGQRDEAQQWGNRHGSGTGLLCRRRRFATGRYDTSDRRHASSIWRRLFARREQIKRILFHCSDRSTTVQKDRIDGIKKKKEKTQNEFFYKLIFLTTHFVLDASRQHHTFAHFW